MHSERSFAQVPRKQLNSSVDIRKWATKVLPIGTHQPAVQHRPPSSCTVSIIDTKLAPYFNTSLWKTCNIIELFQPGRMKIYCLLFTPVLLV